MKRKHYPRKEFKYFADKYPKIFTHECFDFSIGVGWLFLIDSLCNCIQNYLKHNPEAPQVLLVQCKEKFGGLRFYIDGGDEVVRGMISLAESLSFKICEFCGVTKNIGTTIGWTKTLCEECAKKQNVGWVPAEEGNFENNKSVLQS